MSFLPEAPLPDSFPPYQALHQHFGFVPALFRAQSLLPRVIEAEARIADAVLLTPGVLTRVQKESILLRVAVHHGNAYCVTAHCHFLREQGVPAQQLEALTRNHHHAGLPEADVALLDFAVKLGSQPEAMAGGDIETLRKYALSDQQVLEAILMTALTNFLCTLANGLDVTPDFEPVPVPAPGGSPLAVAADVAASRVGPYLRALDRDASEFPPFAFFQQRFGFIPNIFRAQTLRPDVVEAEAFTVGAVLLTDDVLTRVRKEYILLAISAANLNTYCVAVHCEMLRNLGIPAATSDQIAVDHHHSDLSPADKRLLDFALTVARRAPVGVADVDGLHAYGFTDRQILEAVVMASLTNFLNTLQVGLGTVPDFHPRRVFQLAVNLPEDVDHPTTNGPGVVGPPTDPDGETVARAKSGDRDAFESLVRGHHRRVLRMLICVTGHPEDAEDAAQTAFLKAFQHLQDFEGHARFGTWLTRIAINEGLECVRRRRPMGHLAGDEDATDFRPRSVGAWVDDPERLYQREELRTVVERAVAALPLRYRLAVLLRDLEQLSTAEAAAALGLAVPTLKTHLLRGRLMLREALAPYFVPGTATRVTRV